MIVKARMEHKTKFFRVFGVDGEPDSLARSMPSRTDFGDRITAQVMGIAKMLRDASKDDLQSLSLAMALDTPEMRVAVRAIADFSLLDVTWDEIWASLRPL